MREARMVLLLGLFGCQQDLLLVLGDVTRVASLPKAQPAIAATPAQLDPIDNGGVVEPPPVADAAPRAPEPKFNPISIPEGPRATSVKWEGVKQKGITPPPLNSGTTEKARP